METDVAEELRVLARDGGRLTLHDRGVIARAAEIVDMLISTQAQLIESQAARIALHERLSAMILKRNGSLLEPFSMRCSYTIYQTQDTYK
jgi:hypothetical protein